MSAVLALGLVSAAPPDAFARGGEAPRTFGLGIMLGEPTGISAKYWLERNRAIGGGFAYSFGDYGLFFADYLFHFPGAFGHRDPFVAHLDPYIGIGAMAYFGRSGKGVNSGGGLGIRIPLGLEWLPADAPVGVFLELAPGIGIIPSTFGFFQGAVGARFYFSSS